MSSFTSDLRVTPTEDGKFWRVTRQFTYKLGSLYSNQHIHVPAGTLTDFASVPKLFTLILPDWAKINKAAVIHDRLYRIQEVMGDPISRKQADDIWLDAMLLDFRSHKTGGFVAYLEYTAVRLFAWTAWLNYKQVKQGLSKCKLTT